MRLLYGSQNFGYDTAQSDKDWLELRYPSWRDLILREFYYEEKPTSDGGIVFIKDIRSILTLINKANVTSIQFLFSQEKIDCEDLKWYFENRDELIRANLPYAYFTNKGFLEHCLRGTVTPKDKVRAVMVIRYMEKLFHTKSFELRDPSLASLLQDVETLDKEVTTISKRLESLKVPFESTPINNKILQAAYGEMERLVRTRLLNS